MTIQGNADRIFTFLSKLLKIFKFNEPRVLINWHAKQAKRFFSLSAFQVIKPNQLNFKKRVKEVTLEKEETF